MTLNGLFYSLRLHANISLCHGGAAVLQKPLHKGNIIAIGLVYLCGIPLAETVGADTLIAQIIADDLQLLLDGSLCQRENAFFAADAISQTVVFNILLNDKRDCENPLPAFLSKGGTL